MALVKIVFSLLIVLEFLMVTSHGCTSMNGISRKAVLMGMDQNFRDKSRDQQNIEETLRKLSETSSESQNNRNKSWSVLQNENMTIGGKLVGFNMTYHELKTTLEGIDNDEGEGNGHGHSQGTSQIMLSPYMSSTNSGDPSIQFFYPRQNNFTYPIQVQSLTKSSEYIGFKFLNVSSESDDNSTVKTSDFLNDSVEMVDDKDPGRRNSSSHFNLTMENLTLIPSTDQPPLGGAPANVEEEEIFSPEEDKKVNGDWGGNCTVKHWKACYNITVMGDPTEINPLFPKDKKKNKRTQLDCFDTMEAKYFPWLCLKNGWTVNRCHLLCMAQKCNKLLLETRKWDFYVLHEGGCKTSSRKVSRLWAQKETKDKE